MARVFPPDLFTHLIFVSRSVVRFSRLLDFIESKFDFRLRSASSRHVLIDFL